MNGGHDLGGMMGFGPIAPERDEAVFHAPWERRAFALTLAMGMTGSWNIDASRHARERRPPVEYWSLSYYELWLAALEKLMAERALATPDELQSGTMSAPPKRLSRQPRAGDVPAILARGEPASRKPAAPARFAAGDTIHTRNFHPRSHTRLPRYLRGKPGTIAKVHGVHVFPDANAHDRGEDPQWLYGVRFTAAEIWGRAGPDTLCADLWEPYLVPA